MANEAIELPRRNPAVLFFHNTLDQGENLENALPGKSRDEKDRGIVDMPQLLSNTPQVLIRSPRLLFDKIPFVHEEDKSTPRLEGIAGDPGILLYNTTGRIEENKRNITALYAFDGSKDTVILERLSFSPLGPDPCGIYKNILTSLVGKGRIDSIARGAGFGANDDPGFAQDSIHQGGLPDVGPPHDSDGHSIRDYLRFLGRWQETQEVVKQIPHSRPMLR